MRINLFMLVEKLWAKVIKKWHYAEKQSFFFDSIKLFCCFCVKLIVVIQIN